VNLGLLECDHVDERLRAIAGGYPDMIDALLRPHLPDLRFTRFDACHGRLPDSPEDCDAYLCTGSRASVYEARDWIAELTAFVRGLRGSGRPFVGICFGHQVLAQALGGKVARGPQGWGVGVHDMRIVAARGWMQPPLEICRLQYMHQDQVERLPEGAELLARGEHCEVAMFSVDGTMLGIEGHPEFPPAYNEALMRDRVARIGRERVDAGITSFALATHDAIMGRWIAAFLTGAFPHSPL
jgi:GMP synthase-like glutamine amidotransferase